MLLVAGFEDEGDEFWAVCVGYQAVELGCAHSYEDLCLVVLYHQMTIINKVTEVTSNRINRTPNYLNKFTTAQP